MKARGMHALLLMGDEIARICGCPTWNPAQLVRDVRALADERDELRFERDTLRQQLPREVVANTLSHGRVRWTFDDRDGAGRVLVECDGEVWSHRWPARHRGEPADLVAWVADCDLGYAARKMRADLWFDAEETESTARRHVLEARRLEQIDRDDARDLWRGCADAACAATPGAWEVWHSELIRCIPDAWEYRVVRTTVHPAFRAAWDALRAQVRANDQRRFDMAVVGLAGGADRG